MPLELILQTIRDLAREMNWENLREPTPESRLLGSGSGLDSIGLVTLIAELEERLSRQAGRPVVLADERAFSRFHSPFRTVSTLARHVEGLLGDSPSAPSSAPCPPPS